MRSRPKVAVIAGTGVAEQFELGKEKEVPTPYGSARVATDKASGCLFLRRHGSKARIQPHRVNYRANVAALKGLGVEAVLATGAVGSMDRRFGVGRIGTAGQFLDFTRGRAQSFSEEGAVHVDVTNPYSERVNREVAEAGKQVGIEVRRGLVYVCVEGPRYETAAEVRMYRKLGGDVVGMTGVPEVVLAREAGMEYASVLVATNLAAGLQETVSHEEVEGAMARAGKDLRTVLEATIKRLTSGE